MRAYEALADALEQLHVDHLFGLMGDGNLRLVAALEDTDIEYVWARHENSAVSMAHSYARVAGSVGVCTITQGPGFTNAMTALTAAVKGRASIVVIAGEAAESVIDHVQYLDQAALAEAVGCCYMTLRPNSMHRDIALAVKLAERQRRPVIAGFRADRQEVEVESLWQGASYPGDFEVNIEPPRDAIIGAVELIEFSSRPVIIAGNGVVWSGSENAVGALAERIGALTATTIPAKGLFSSDPFCVGVAGDFATEIGSELISQADLIIGIGASLNYSTTAGMELFGDRLHVIHCDNDMGVIGRHIDPTVAVVGDAARFAELVSDALTSRAQRYRSESIRTKIADSRGRPMPGLGGSDGALVIDPRDVVSRLQEMLPSERSLVVDGGHFTGWPLALAVPDPRAFVFSCNFGAVGLGMGAVIGAQIGRPDRLPVLFIGDGGLSMTLGELETACQRQSPFLVCVMNDAAYGAEAHHLQMLGLPDSSAGFPDTDFVSIVQALGGSAIQVTNVEDLEGVSDWLADPHGLLLLDCRIDPTVRASWLEQAIRPSLRSKSEA